jgi:phosphate transport system permease protein
VLVPLVREQFAGDGNSLFTASILPGRDDSTHHHFHSARAALRAVDPMFQQGALALGATREISVIRVVVPAASRASLPRSCWELGAAIGETMAVIWIAGNQPVIPESIFEGVRTMTANIVMEMGYARACTARRLSPPRGALCLHSHAQHMLFAAQPQKG